MTEPVKIGILAESGLSIDLFSSIAPSREVCPSQDGLVLSVTVFGEDPDEPVQAAELKGTALVSALEKVLFEGGPKLGLRVNQSESDGRVEWESAEDNHSLIAEFEYTNPATREVSPTSTECPNEIAIVLRLSNKVVANSAFADLGYLEATVSSSEEGTAAIGGLYSRVLDRLSTLFPRCLNPVWQKRLMNESIAVPLVGRSIARALASSTNPHTADAFAVLQKRLRVLTVDNDLSNMSIDTGEETPNLATLESQLAPSMAATARHLLSPDRALGTVKHKRLAKARQPPTEKAIEDSQADRPVVVQSNPDAVERAAGSDGWNEFDEDGIGGDLHEDEDDGGLDWDDSDDGAQKPIGAGRDDDVCSVDGFESDAESELEFESDSDSVQARPSIAQDGAADDELLSWGDLAELDELPEQSDVLLEEDTPHTVKEDELAF